MFPLYLRGFKGKDRRGDGGQVLRAQVLRGVGNLQGSLPLRFNIGYRRGPQPKVGIPAKVGTSPSEGRYPEPQKVHSIQSINFDVIYDDH